MVRSHPPRAPGYAATMPSLRTLLSALALLSLAGPSAEAGEGLQERLAAMRAKHGIAAPRDLRLKAGFSAEDRAFLAKFPTRSIDDDGVWIPVEDLALGDWILMAYAGAKVTAIQDGQYAITWAEFSNKNLLDKANWIGGRYNQTCCLRKVPPKAAGGFGRTGYLVYKLHASSPRIIATLEALAAKAKKRADRAEYNQRMAEKERYERERRLANEAGNAARRAKAIEASEAMARPSSTPPVSTYRPPVSSSSGRTSSGLGPAYKSPTPRIGSTEWEIRRRINKPISTYQNRY